MREDAEPGRAPSAGRETHDRRIARARWTRLRWFALWLGAFYGAWLTLIISGDHWATLVDHWGIALAMALGSYVAGSTPMGGGTIGFPILVLLFDEPAAIGRHFSFAVQSIGMVSASIFIFAVGRPVAWRVLGWAMLGSTLGTPLGLAFIAPRVDDLTVKLIFAVLWASFGLMHLIKVREIVALYGYISGTPRFDRTLGFTIGAGGGMLVASITGVGIDLLIYIALVLLVRADIRIAIPTSIVLMAYTSLLGIGTSAILAASGPAKYAIDPAVYQNWLAAAPVVALGAPLGALMVYLIPRATTLVFVSVLCLGQFIWTCVNENVTGATLFFAIASVLLANLVLAALYRVGLRRSRSGPLRTTHA